MTRLNPDRYLALDLGDRRIGIAVGSADAALPQPLEVIQRPDDERHLARQIRQIVNRERCGVIVVGDPLNMDGSSGERSEGARQFAQWIGRAIRQARVELQDERLSSFTADERMDREGLSPARQKKLRDAYAAAVILQEFFDTQQKESD